MSWASRRQVKYFSGFMFFVLAIIFIFLYPIIFKKATCFDNKQNGNETGIDCGGSCSMMCKSDISEPVVIWSRAFHVVDSTYNLVAFVENRNKNSGAVSAPYEFRVYDVNNQLIGRKEGITFIPPNQQFAVFESRFDSKESILKSVTFEFSSPIAWVRKAPTLQTLPIRISDINYDDNKDTPKLSATINNDSIYDIPEFDVVAILYDAEHNAINASKTHKYKLINNTSLPVTFTWPEVLSAVPVTKDILVLINPFAVSF